MLRTIRLELARTKDFPEGSAAHGYEFVAPLDAEGRIDAEAYRRERAGCVVRRFWRGDADEVGHLVPTRRQTWAFSYGPGEEDDEPFHHLETHRLMVGEYVSIREHDGETRTFRVVSVR